MREEVRSGYDSEDPDVLKDEWLLQHEIRMLKRMILEVKLAEISVLIH